MSGRGRGSRLSFDGGRRGYPDIREGPYYRAPIDRPPPHELYEEELHLQQLELQRMDLRRLEADNRTIAEDRAALQRELLAAKEEHQRLHFAIADIHADKDAHARDLVDRGLKLEADLRAAEPLRKDVIQLRAEVQKLNAMKEELAAQVQNLTREMSRAQAENQQIPALRNEMEGLHQEVIRARTAFEYEKKGNAELVEQRHAIEKNLVSMSREIEKLRAELARNDGRPWGVGGPYGTKLGSPEGPFPPYGEGYSLHKGVADKAPMYGAGPESWGAVEKSRLARR